MKTQYMPRGSDLVASAFRRLDREIAILHRQIALSALFSWNLESWAPGRNRVLVAPDPVERKRSRWELAVALVLACLALCACEPEDTKPREPDISDPFRPPPYMRPQVRALQAYPSGEVVIVIQRGAE